VDPSLEIAEGPLSTEGDLVMKDFNVKQAQR
jgi:hypothetical protein